MRMEWADVSHFWQAYDKLPTATASADSAAILKTYYLDVASPGLLAYVEAAHASPVNFVQAIRTHRRYLAAIRPATLRIQQQLPGIRQAARQLKALYPAATFPSLYFAIGKFEVGGSAFPNLLYVGAELKCATTSAPLQEIRPDIRDGVVPVEATSTACIHEIIHGQQQPTAFTTNLEGALREGAAEYVAYRLTKRLGSPAAFAYSRHCAAALRREFAQEANQPIAAKWFIATTDATGRRPGALGYVIGFRICEAYYQQAADKGAALRDIISLANMPALLAAGHRYLGS